LKTSPPSRTPDPARVIRDELARLGAPRSPVDPATVQVMKPEIRERPFSRAGWIFELKHDGFRMLAAGGLGAARLLYKKGRDTTRVFPEVAEAVAGLPFGSLLLDGEVVVLDEEGRPDFNKLHKRGLGTRPVPPSQITDPAVLFVFDLLAFEDFDLRPLPLLTRKAFLRRVVPGEGLVRLSDEIPERGEDLYAAVIGMGLEGIIGKRADSPYRAGRSADWLKVKAARTGDFAVIGFDPVPGSPKGFRAFYLATRQGSDSWQFVGSVGTGFTSGDVAEIWPRLDSARRPRPVVAVPPEDQLKTAIWIEPRIVVEVRYKDWTEGGHLRHAVFLRLRDDKTVDECTPPGGERMEEQEPPGEPPAETPPAEPPAAAGPVPFTNLDKVFWPEEGITKGDLVEFYRAIAPWMLPFLRDRPLVLDRYPNGVAGKSFFQKTVPAGTSGRFRTVFLDAGGSDRGHEYVLCDDVETLLELVNLAAIPFHIWASRVTDVERPDWCILDLDPKSAPFTHVVAIARAVRELCEEIELPSFIKTSGGSGLHVLMPTGGQLDFDQVRQLAELLAGVIVARMPAIATTARAIRAREGRVYVDALQNGRGKLLVAPYSVRPRPGAPLSTPLQWNEVNDSLDVRAFNIKTVPPRVRKLKQDPLLPVLDVKPDLERSLGLLSERLG
jgi:bifunctional non-homologous end joining protein LigD